MKNLKRFLRKNITFVVSIFVVIFVFGLSVGYSVFNTEMSISGVVTKVRPIEDIRITNLTQDSFTGNANVNYSEFTKNKLYFNFSLPDNTSTVTYKVEIKNIGTIEMAVAEMNGVPEGLAYSFNGYTLNDKICDNSGLCSGMVKEFYITFSPTSTITDFNFNLEFSFKPIYNVTYTGISDVSGYPSTVIDGKNLQIDFGANATSRIDVYQDGVLLTDYTYSSGVLTTNVINGNINITLSTLYYGDIDGDGIINEQDYEYLDQYLKGLKTFSPSQLQASDINSDGVINNIDVNIILQMASGIYDISTGPITNYVLYGDVDENGEVTENDLTLLSAYLDGSQTEFTEQAIKNMDVNADSVLDETDKTLLQEFLNGSYENTLPTKPITE